MIVRELHDLIAPLPNETLVMWTEPGKTPVNVAVFRGKLIEKLFVDGEEVRTQKDVLFVAKE